MTAPATGASRLLKAKVGTFTGSATAGADYIALYPYDSSAVLNESGIADVTLKPVQTATLDGFDPECSIMTAFAESGSNELAFKNAVAYAKVTVDFECREIVVNAKGAAIAGKLEIDGVDSVPAASVTSGSSDKVTLVPAAGAQYFASGTYLIAVAPAALENGIEMTFHRAGITKSSDDVYYVKSTSKALAFSRSSILDSGSFSKVYSGWTEVKTWLGSGTAEDPFQIYNFNQLKNISSAVQEGKNTSSHFKIMNNIDCDNSPIYPIGTVEHPFKGTVDGQGFTISGLKLGYFIDGNVESDPLFAGLFGDAEGLTVRDLTLDIQDTLELEKHEAFIGGFCARGLDETFSRCTLKGNIGVESHAQILPNPAPALAYGGMVGLIVKGTSSSITFTDCTNKATFHNSELFHKQLVGGLVGQANIVDQAMTITGCTNEGEFNIGSGVQLVYCGGLMGSYISDGRLVCDSCANKGYMDFKEDGTVYVGGAFGAIRGEHIDNQPVSIISNFVNDCSKGATISGYHVDAGGVVGDVLMEDLSIDRCRNYTDITVRCRQGNGGSTNPSGLGGIIGCLKDIALEIQLKKFVVSNCVNHAKLSNTLEGLEDDAFSAIGGIFGYCDSDGNGDYEPIFANCLNKGKLHIDGEISYAAGIGGGCFDHCTHIYCCANIGEITSAGSRYLGGIAGARNKTTSTVGYGDLEYCYWTDASLDGVYGNGHKAGSIMYVKEDLSSGDMNSAKEIILDDHTYNGVNVDWVDWIGSGSALDLKF